MASGTHFLIYSANVIRGKYYYACVMVGKKMVLGLVLHSPVTPALSCGTGNISRSKPAWVT